MLPASPDCSRTHSSLDNLICREPALQALDERLEQIRTRLRERLTADQWRAHSRRHRDWQLHRDACWASEMPVNCLIPSYRHQIATLEAHHDLVQATGPFVYDCDDSEGDQVRVLYYNTDPATALAHRGDESALLHLSPSASGALYRNETVSLWSKGDQALVRWGPEARGNPLMDCRIPY